MEKEEIQKKINQITSELKNCNDDYLYKRLWNERVDLIHKLEEFKN